MDDEIIVLSEVCHNLTNNKEDATKLHNGYANLCRKPDSALFYGDKEVVENGKIKYIKTVKPDEFYPWVVGRLRKKNLLETIRSNIPEKYTTHYLEAAPLTSTPTLSTLNLVRIMYPNPTPDQRYTMQIEELLVECSKKNSTLEEEINNLKNRLAKCEKELAEAQKKAEINKKKGKISIHF
jgi:predicted ribosome quality control (RQC) complex YloA/Tae2 family protein